MARLTHSLLAISLFSVQFAAAIPAHDSNARNARLDARSPQGLGGALTATGGTLGSALGGVGSLLGGLVGGVGGLLGNTVAGVGTAVANLVGYKPAPKDAPPVQVPPQPPQPQGPTSLQTIGGDIVCHHWPDRITAFGRRERIVNSQTGPVIPRCWSPPDFVGAPEGDSNWIGVSHDATDKCFVSVKDVANGEAIRATLPKCDRKTKHYIGTLGPQYIDNSYCYKTPYLDETQSQIGAKVAPAKEGSFFDVLCFTNGGRYSNEEDSTWYRTNIDDKDCYLPKGYLLPNGFFPRNSQTLVDCNRLDQMMASRPNK